MRRYFFTHNPGLLDQPVLYVTSAPKQSRRILIDPNQLSDDGTTALTAVAPSPDGRLIAYAVSEHGSDRQVIRIRRVDDAQDLDDRLSWVKFASIAWTRDGSAFYYLRFPEPGSVPQEDEQYFGRIYFHRLGDSQALDVLVFEKPDEKAVVPMVHVTADDRYVVITAQHGASDDSEVYLVDRATDGDRRPLFTGFDAAYDFIEESDGLLYFRTTRDAPRGRIVSVDPALPVPVLHEVVPEAAHRLSTAVMAGDTLVAVYLENASDRVVRFGLDGSARGRPELPGLGSIVTIDARPDRDEVVFVFTSFTDPPSAWVARGSVISGLNAGATYGSESIAGLSMRSAGSSSLQAGDPHAYQTTQVWYPSKDGTPVSMFLVHRADLVRGRQPAGAAERLRRIQYQSHAGLRSGQLPAARPRRHLRAGEPARRRRVPARSGIGPACSSASRTCSTISLPPPNT